MAPDRMLSATAGWAAGLVALGHFSHMWHSAHHAAVPAGALHSGQCRHRTGVRSRACSRTWRPTVADTGWW